MNQALKALGYAFSNTDIFSFIIIIALFVASVYSISLMFEKWVQISTAYCMNRQFMKGFRDSSNVLHLANQLKKFEEAPMMEVYRRGLCEIMEVLDLSDRRIKECCQDQRLPRSLEEYEIQRVRAMMEREVSDKIIALEAKINNISTIVSLAPFLGLLGTVVGITVTLCSAAMNGGRMDFGIIGPGICGALLTTVFGLLVAIPALVGSNTIIGRLREVTAEMENFVDDFLTLLNLQSNEIKHKQKEKSPLQAQTPEGTPLVQPSLLVKE